MNVNTYLRGRTALVTGSVQGIGLAVARALGSAGARVAVHGLATLEAANDAVTAVRHAGAPEARFFAGDLLDRGALRDLVDGVSRWSGSDGGPDILVNNAGIQKTESFASISNETWDMVLGVNLTAPFLTMRQALPHMARRGYGRVINIASVHGLVASVDKAAYVASKFGLVGMSRAAALEYARTGTREGGGVTVNCICPGWTETALIEPQIASRTALAGGDRTSGVNVLLAEKQPTLRMSSPEEIGFMVLWLVSPLAHNITGTAIPVDGGWTAQ